MSTPITKINNSNAQRKKNMQQTMKWMLTYKFRFGLRDLPDDGVLLVVARCQYLITFEAEARACYFGSAANGVIIFLLHFFKIIVRNVESSLIS